MAVDTLVLSFPETVFSTKRTTQSATLTATIVIFSMPTISPTAKTVSFFCPRSARLQPLSNLADGLCAEKSCSKLRIKDSVHCRKHACLERGCSKPCLSNLKYCVHHKCNMNACMGPKGWKQDAKTREAFCFNRTLIRISVFTRPLLPTNILDLCHETDCSESVESLHIYCVLRKSMLTFSHYPICLSNHSTDECQEEPTCIAKVADGGACIQRKPQPSTLNFLFTW